MSTISKGQRKELQALNAVRNSDIDTSHIRELKDWNGAFGGVFYRPVKGPGTIRLDAGVVA